MTIVLSGSLAFDYIMNFPGYFEDHILPDKIHVLNVSFLVDSLDRQRGGVAGNIAYNLGLLGRPCRLVGTVGSDFGDYRSTLVELGVDVEHIVEIEETVTGSAYITTDRADNQITGFFPGAMGRAGEYGINNALRGAQVAAVSPTSPDAMRRHVAELATAGMPFLFDPGQQVIALSGDDLIAGIDSATMLAANDYELAMIEEKTGMTRDEIVAKVPVVAVTFGDLGSTIFVDDSSVDIPAVEPWSVVDPTGAGDGYRAGLLAGFTMNFDWGVTGRIAATAASFAVEQKGTQAHQYSAEEFRDRFEAEFPEDVSAVDALFAAT